jgi:small multidrug resistance pump
MTGPGAYAVLAAAIVAEVVATVSLKATEGFTRLWPIALVVGGYAISFWLLSLSLERLPLAVVYCVWAGFGMAGAAIAGWLLFGEALDVSAVAGIALIAAGVYVLARAMGGPAA